MNKTTCALLPLVTAAAFGYFALAAQTAMPANTCSPAVAVCGNGGGSGSGSGSASGSCSPAVATCGSGGVSGGSGNGSGTAVSPVALANARSALAGNTSPAAKNAGLAIGNVLAHPNSSRARAVAIRAIGKVLATEKLRPKAHKALQRALLQLKQAR